MSESSMHIHSGQWLVTVLGGPCWDPTALSSASLLFFSERWHFFFTSLVVFAQHCLVNLGRVTSSLHFILAMLSSL